MTEQREHKREAPRVARYIADGESIVVVVMLVVVVVMVMLGGTIDCCSYSQTWNGILSTTEVYRSTELVEIQRCRLHL